MGATASVSSAPTGTKAAEDASGTNAQSQSSTAYSGGVVGLPIRAQYTPFGRQDVDSAYRPAKLVNESEPWRLHATGTELWEVYLSRTGHADEVAARVRSRAKFNARNWTSFCYSIFAALDRDGNGVLRQSEWGRVVLKIFEYMSADINKEMGAPSVAELRELERSISDCLRAEMFRPAEFGEIVKLVFTWLVLHALECGVFPQLEMWELLYDGLNISDDSAVRIHSVSFATGVLPHAASVVSCLAAQAWYPA